MIFYENRFLLNPRSGRRLPKTIIGNGICQIVSEASMANIAWYKHHPIPARCFSTIKKATRSFCLESVNMFKLVNFFELKMIFGIVFFQAMRIIVSFSYISVAVVAIRMGESTRKVVFLNYSKTGLSILHQKQNCQIPISKWAISLLPMMPFHCQRDYWSRTHCRIWRTSNARSIFAWAELEEQSKIHTAFVRPGGGC